jgi:hypothetical protein
VARQPLHQQQQPQHQQRAALQPLQALATSLQQPLAQLEQPKQQWQQRLCRQQGRQQRLVLVYAVAPEAAGSKDDSGLDPNIPAVDQDFDLLGAEVSEGQELLCKVGQRFEHVLSCVVDTQ